MTRVIAGEHKGLNLHNPPGKSIRPSTDRTKEWIYSVLYDVSELTVLDIFCGAGNLGIEALSRGASRCTFVDSASKAVKLTTENIALTEYEDRTQVIRLDALKFLKEAGALFDLIVADPPYEYEDIEKLIPLAVDRLTEPGRFFLETSLPITGTLPDHITEIRQESMGGTVVTVYGELE
ncbi:MAG: RsmD family RNA methyltransferase [Candidatus Marinimicrobia bacterium]|nr:RsmD family RNA methyltransferase [Candidatus Neomarinimicrobiota bacterium]MCF7827713.1 RsmD family RNA methyltransferase [Candidatus Neomarinimicrobiota bacterium]MCF7881232.1 RsmD family RNA methyltransferase [Candidatus Neomarinimicrobiota bacterium]